MASPFVADVGRAVRGVPRTALRWPRSVLSWRRLVVALVLGIALAVAYTFWFRHSSLVAVEEVEVSKLSFAEAEVTAALTGAGKEMTTLDVDSSALERAVRGFPTVAAVSVEADFPHRLAIEVTERRPIATVGAGEGVPVAGDGTVLSGISVGELELPPIEADRAPATGTLDGVSLAQAEVLGAAPDPLRPAIRAAGVDDDYGVVVDLEGEVELRFGDSRDARAKWAAAAAVLADPKLDGLTYIDLRLPGRPAVGGASLPASEAVETNEAIAPAPLTEAPPVTADPAAAAPPPTAPAATDPAPAAPESAAPAPPAPAHASGVAGATAAP